MAAVGDKVTVTIGGEGTGRDRCVRFNNRGERKIIGGPG